MIRLLLLLTLITGVVYPVAVTAMFGSDGDLSLVAQRFTQEKYFWPRPSAVDYNAAASGGSNLGPKRSERVGASGSGLDPHISPEAARAQIARVARARGMEEGDVEQRVRQLEEGRLLGLFGEPRVNVLRLNRALDE